MSNSRIQKIIGAIVFFISAIQFFKTAQPTVPFWDPGELSAAAALLQVPHPPGGPLFSLVGRIFYLLPIPGDLGFRMNAMSVIASVFSVLFLYLIAVKLIENYKGKEPQNRREALGTYISAAIGALALSFCDTFWFNGVESNYFAAATLLFSAMVWLMLRWNEISDQPGSNRYLVLIAYLIGLSAGVHLMSVPTIFAVVMVVVFKKYVTDDAYCKRTGLIFLGHVALLLLVSFAMWNSLTSSEPPMPEDAHAYDRKFMMVMGAISAGVLGIFWKKVFHRDSFYIPILVAAVALGVAYPGVIKKLPQLIHTLSGDDSTLGVLILLGVVAVLGYVAYWATKHKKGLLDLAALGVLFIILGFSTYTMIVLRANQNPPMNENDPKSFSRLLTYLNREQYGDFPIFKRRWTTEPDRQRTFTEYSSDFDFFWRYQMNHMFTRYIMFNFSGSVSRNQDAGWTLKQLYGIPFLIGLFGLYWQFRKDWRMASVFLILFVIMGFLIAFYQNQQEPQPRERDYFYAGAYFVFALWIALGIRGLLDLVNETLKEPRTAGAAFAGVLVLGTFFIPVRMFQKNYHTHDRSGDFVPWDYSYNMLQTCERDAILVTNGDNDTFPLWYLQDVEGIRRDVRIVNLSLVNTSWYIQQLKDKPYYAEAKPVPISLSDARIESISPIRWDPRVMEIPVPEEVRARYRLSDTTVSGFATADTSGGGEAKITWTMPNTMTVGGVKAIRVQDIMLLDILRTNQWKQPIYFAVTCAPDSKLGLDEYLWFEGLAWRLEPRKVNRNEMGLNEAVLRKNLFDTSDVVSAGPRYGYKFRGVADPDVHFDENTSRLMLNYRSGFVRLAMYYNNLKQDPVRAAEALERMERLIPESKIPYGWELGADLANFYFRLGKAERFNELAANVERECRAVIDAGKVDMNNYYNPYRVLLEIYDAQKEYGKTLDLLKSLEVMYPNDPGLKQRIADVQRLVASQAGRDSAKQLPGSRP